MRLGIISKAGSWFSMGETRIGQGRDAAKKYLEENPDIAADVEAQIRANFDKLMGNQSRIAAAKAAGKAVANRDNGTNAGGVRVTQIVDDPSPLKLVYDPTHPDANEEGYVEMPNVDTVKEITDAMAATQAYSANVTAFNTLKSVIAKGLEIGG